jgi:hypothetical protein
VDQLEQLSPFSPSCFFFLFFCEYSKRFMNYERKVLDERDPEFHCNIALLSCRLMSLPAFLLHSSICSI